MSTNAYECSGPVDEEFTLAANPVGGPAHSRDALVDQFRNDPRVDSVVIVPPDRYELDEFFDDDEVHDSDENGKHHHQAKGAQPRCRASQKQ